MEPRPQDLGAERQRALNESSVDDQNRSSAV